MPPSTPPASSRCGVVFKFGHMNLAMLYPIPQEASPPYSRARDVGRLLKSLTVTGAAVVNDCQEPDPPAMPAGRP